jgi:hypothetical protein
MRSAFVLTLLFIAGLVAGQQVPRDKVIVEVGTGTWCQYCPGAAMGIEDLLANGCEIAAVEYHNGDEYENSYGNARLNYYGIGSFPTAKFDGVLTVVGGSNTQSMYAQYLPKYNQRKAVQSSFTISAGGTHSGLQTYSVTVTVTKVASTTSTSMVLHAALTESNIEEYWQGMTEVDFVERLMAPNQNGTTLNFSGGDVQVVNLTFIRQPDWVVENCELTLFIQDTQTKEILQGTKIDISDFPSSNNYDAGLAKVMQIPDASCTGSLTPKVEIVNYGNQDLTSLDIKYEINSGPTTSFAWTGNLAYLQSAEVELPSASFTVQASNTVTVHTENPNGQPDQYTQNDTRSVTFIEAPQVGTPIILYFRTDQKPAETTWELKDETGNVLYSGGPYPQPETFYKDTFYFSINGCYRFIVHDTGGDGMCCEYGMGIYFLKTAANLTIAEGGEFDYYAEYDLQVTATSMAEETAPGGFEIFPNPAGEHCQISLDLAGAQPVRVQVYDARGNLVNNLDKGLLPQGRCSILLDCKDLSPGIYYIKVQAGENFYGRKMILSR